MHAFDLELSEAEVEVGDIEARLRVISMNDGSSSEGFSKPWSRSGSAWRGYGLRAALERELQVGT